MVGDHRGRLYLNGIPYDKAIDEVKGILKDAIVVGHNICDFRALELPMYPTVHCVYDTATNASLKVLVNCDNLQPKLASLAERLLGIKIQRHRVHNPRKDALASLRIFCETKNIHWEPLGDPRRVGTLRDGRTITLD